MLLPIVALAQYPITPFPDFNAWRQHISRWVADAARPGARLLVFPEYASMELAALFPPPIASDLMAQIEAINGLQADFLDVFSTLADQWRVTIVAPSLPADTEKGTVNRTWVCGPGGKTGYQDKWMMTRFEHEDWQISAGARQLTVFETDWGKFGIQTCYDVEFPLGSQMLCAHGVQLIVAPSCTETLRGATRVHVGARARALENQCYVGISQVIGEALWSPAVDINFGYAAVYSTPDNGFPEDGILQQLTPQQPGWLLQKLDFDLIAKVRQQGQVLNFRDSMNNMIKNNGVTMLNLVI